MAQKSLVLSSLGLASAALSPVSAAESVNGTPASAPQLAQVPPQASTFSWTGFYVGVNGGGIQQSTRQRAFEPSTPVFDYCWASNCELERTDEATGLIGGIQGGYNFQAGMWVFGGEVDFAGTTASENHRHNHNGYTWRARTGIDALGTARLRAGYTFGGALAYLTGGLALGHVTVRERVDDNFSWSKRSGWRWGYTGGAGMELAGPRGWSFRVEGLYYLLPDEKKHVSEFGVGSYGLKERVSGVVGRVGVNYRF